MNKLDLHIDFSCPFSYIGSEKLLQFIEKENLPEDIVRFRSFLLNPTKDNVNKVFLENMTKKFGTSNIAETKERYRGIIEAAKRVGLNYDLDTIIDVNSKNAHKGLQFAIEEGKQNDYVRKVFSLHFEKGGDFNDLDTLVEVIKSIGLDGEKFLSNLDRLNELVDKDLQLAADRGVNSVPTFYANGRILLQGTGSFEEFKQITDSL
ncbi:Predicted dithiol-disulfide isomerase, DsbA family [Anaerosphaera aminiphila DSM 21120]|uniref:Predicted dithiol-disulfide isomerase, DsbA family n=1 Tax=Anaerosphaera aminiphila DSM 21120 TaxID=1120995 RepID=A0A1M5T2W1_9FIRM|nr:DsbA family oxidoreductase [Anaerosphaera aminiphila]SHH45085.1 Predicted dithiol-disulfide isomerase, DsbA family [Anaerosphaera aminiphila DSM 21120]